MYTRAVHTITLLSPPTYTHCHILYRPLITRLSSSDSVSYHTNEFDDQEFARMVRTAESTIEAGVLPQMIAQGSSGSYFVKNQDNVSIIHCVHT